LRCAAPPLDSFETHGVSHAFRKRLHLLLANDLVHAGRLEHCAVILNLHFRFRLGAISGAFQLEVVVRICVRVALRRVIALFSSCSFARALDFFFFESIFRCTSFFVFAAAAAAFASSSSQSFAKWLGLLQMKHLFTSFDLSSPPLPQSPLPSPLPLPLVSPPQVTAALSARLAGPLVPMPFNIESIFVY